MRHALNRAYDEAAFAEADGAVVAEDAAPQLVLTALMAMPNIAESLTEMRLNEAAHKVLEEYRIDKQSRDEWETRVQTAIELAMLVSEQKNYPWTRASNIKYPLLTVAALQFNARAYPAIVQGNRVVKCAVWGRDPEGKKAARGERVAEYMSYQLLAEMPEWEEDTDRMLVVLPIVGCAFRKVWFDPSLKRNKTSFVTAERLVVNYFARSLEDAPRVTEEMHLYPYEIQERINSGRFIPLEYGTAVVEETTDGKTTTVASDDPDGPHLFLEQHRLLDLDEDGYPEPYIVTVHHNTQKVCRIVANYSEESISYDGDKISAIRKQQYYVKYQFMPSPDGGFYGMGFGTLIKDLSEATNTLANQMVDAGHLAVVQGGLVSGSLGIKEKKITLSPGEWRVVNSSVPMNQAVYPINYPGPSPVLFTLLGLMIDAAKDITGVKDVLTGESMGKNASPTTTMALIEQGLTQFTAIYKRIHRALKAELGIQARLNKKHVDPQKYAEFFDEPEQQQAPAPDPQSMAAQQGQGMPGMQPMQPGLQPQQAPMMGQQGQGQPNPAQDFDENDNDILPVSDPSMVSKLQRLSLADFVYQTSKENPSVNQAAALDRVFEAAGVEKREELIVQQPPPNPEVQDLIKRGAIAEVEEKEASVKLKLAQAYLAKEQGELIDTDAAASTEETVARLTMENTAMRADGAMKGADVAIKDKELALKDKEIALKQMDLELKLAEASKPAPVDGKSEFERVKHADTMELERKKLKMHREIELAKIGKQDKATADGGVETIDKQDEHNAAMLDAMKIVTEAQKGVIEAVTDLKKQAAAPKKVEIVKGKDGRVSGATITQTEVN